MSDWCDFIAEKARRIADVLIEPEVTKTDREHILHLATEIIKRKDQRPYTKMDCAKTSQEEIQYLVKERDEGVTLRCGGCGKEHSHEIGEFAHLYEDYTTRVRDDYAER